MNGMMGLGTKPGESFLERKERDFSSSTVSDGFMFDNDSLNDFLDSADSFSSVSHHFNYQFLYYFSCYGCVGVSNSMPAFRLFFCFWSSLIPPRPSIASKLV